MRNGFVCLLGALLVIAAAAPAFAENSVKPGPSLKAVGGSRIAVPMAALGKEYLISISTIPQYQAPTSKGLAGHIVTFELYDDSLDMYESTRGQVVTDELPSRLLLATFPIVKKQKNQIIIDFNSGMRRVFTNQWIGSSQFSSSERTRVLEVPQARVFSIEDKKGMLEIRQAVQARSRERSQDVEQRLEIRYFIAPYTGDKFKAKANMPTSSRYVRFFQTAPTLELTSGRSIAHTARFNIEKPVTFYYSQNTPEEYVEAVRQGVLYWNGAFGKEVVRCEKAPEGVTAPSADHNIVQWVPWDSAGFAYADILVDPRTGQSMHGQAYMTSVFAISGVQRARLVLRRLRALEEQKEDDKSDDKKLTSQLLGLPLFRSTASCETDIAEYAEQMAVGLEAMLADPEAGDAALLRASRDYVCNVTAHEVGHVLGLRHNFAGSLSANVSPKELYDWFDKYVESEEPPKMEGKLTTSSVMEYSVFEAAVFSGWKMRTTDVVFPHDKAAIQWGYFEDESAISDKMLFGSDDDVFTYGDLQRFDYGVEPIVGSLAEVGRTINGLPVRVIERFVSAKAPRDPRDAIPLEQVNLRPSSDVNRLISDYREGLKWFGSSVRSIRLERDFDFVGDLNEEERREVHWKSLNEQIEKVGGVDRFAFSFVPLSLSLDLKGEVKDATPPEKFDAAKLAAKVGELLDGDSYKEFVGADGETYSFTDEEKKLIRERAKIYFEEFERQLIRRLLQTWASTKRDLGSKVEGYVADDDIVAKLEKQIIAAAKLVVMSRDEKDPEARIQGKVDKAFVEVIDFKYDLETRQEAAKMLADGAGSYPAWAKESRAAMGKELKSLVDSSLNINNFKDFSDGKLSRPLRDWYLDQQTLLRQLK